MRNVRRSAAAVLAAAILAAAAVTRAQVGGTGGETTGSAGREPRKSIVATPPASAATAIQRWFELQAASVLARYRRVATTAGTVTIDQVQDSVALTARFKFDAAGNYSIGAGAATGGTFTSGWNNTGLGTGDRTTYFYLKQLFAAVSPVRGVSFFAGSVSFVRGESTEITTYDNDGYLLGERITVSRPADLYLDEISFTNAFLGDLTMPGFTSRVDRFDESNYRHLLARKAVRPWMSLSADYTRLNGVGTVRAAAAVRTPGAHLIDLVQYEQYRRGGPEAAFGFAAFAEKTLAKRVVARAGYTDIDERYGGLNADKFTVGRRWYAQSDFLLTRDLTAWVFVSHAVGNSFPVPFASRIDVVFTFNAMGPIRRAGLFR